MGICTRKLLLCPHKICRKRSYGLFAPFWCCLQSPRCKMGTCKHKLCPLRVRPSREIGSRICGDDLLDLYAPCSSRIHYSADTWTRLANCQSSKVSRKMCISWMGWKCKFGKPRVFPKNLVFEAQPLIFTGSGGSRYIYIYMMLFFISRSNVPTPLGLHMSAVMCV